jgi:ubiquinone/menaquinone biosynthesis C-methylase UbiE
MDWTNVMTQFWNERARENAPHFIATNAASYDQPDMAAFFNSGEEEVSHFLAAIDYNPSVEMKMLEIGCGIGRMTRALAKRFGTVYGIDISSEMIDQGKRYLADCSNVHLSVSSGTDLCQFDNASIDFCFSYIVFQHIPDPAITVNYISEIGRVLKPGGIAYFQVNTRVWPLDSLRRRLQPRARLQRLLGAPSYISPAWVGSTLPVETLRQAIEAAGLKLERLTGVGTQYTWVLCQC